MQKDTEQPSKFLWGAATAAHQVEGGTHNDWTLWEREHADELVRRAMMRPDTERERFPEMTRRENYISGAATEHYTRYKKDFQIAADLHHNAHRFSIEWSRVEPRKGVWNNEAIKHYRDVIDELKKLNIEPVVTLYHWTMPVWFSDMGGWLHPHAHIAFEKFVERMVLAFPDVKFWITVNEPTVYSSHGYAKGNWPPGKRSLPLTLQTLRALAKSHITAYHAIHARIPNAHVGIASHSIAFYGIVAPLKRYFWNQWFLDRIHPCHDFVGLNYYFSNHKSEFQSDMGWGLFPEGLEDVLVELKRYRRPVIITEIGLADATDKHRAWYIASSVQAMKRAIERGVDVWGYLYWSLLDNFEWEKGYWPRFGLVEIDYKTKRRNVRKSAFIYRDIIDSWHM